jgi:hypothetical protein
MSMFLPEQSQPTPSGVSQFTPSSPASTQEDVALMQRVFQAAAANPLMLPSDFMAYLVDYVQTSNLAIPIKQVFGAQNLVDATVAAAVAEAVPAAVASAVPAAVTAAQPNIDAAQAAAIATALANSAPRTAEITTSELPVSGSATWSNLTTDGPTVTAPVTGNYFAVAYATGDASGTGATNEFRIGIDIGNVTPSKPWGRAFLGGNQKQTLAVGRKIACSAGDVVKLRYWINDAALAFRYRELSLFLMAP